MRNNYVLVNQWIARFQGHGRSELRAVKMQLSARGHFAQIISPHSDFGDLVFKVPFGRLNLLPQWVIRGPIYRFHSRFRTKMLIRSWMKVCAKIHSKLETRVDLVVTSSSFFELFELLKVNAPGVVIHCRITHVDFRFLMHMNHLKLMENALVEKRLVLAFETSQALSKFREISTLNAKIVPPAQGIDHGAWWQPAVGLAIGLIWPLTAYPSVEEVEDFLRCLPEECSAIIRLPHRIKESSINVTSPNWKFMPHDLNDDKYLQFFEDIGVCILPHNNYHFKGSGLAYQLISMGIPVIAIRDNAFVDDLLQYSLMIPVEKLNPENIKEATLRALKISANERESQAHNLIKQVSTAWADFLN